MTSTITGPYEWSEEILQEIFRHTPVGVALTDLHGTILDVNEALCAVVGYPRDQIVGRNSVSFIHPEDIEKAQMLLSEFRERGAGSRRVTGRLLSRSGRLVWANITLSVVRSRGEEPIFGVAFIEDVTESMELEKTLQDTAALYRQVVHDQNEMIVRWKPDGTRTFVNEAYARYFGLSQSDLIGTSFKPLIVEEDRPFVDAEIRALTPGMPSRTGVHRVILADGSVRWNEWTDRATFDQHGQITIMQSIGRDVTDRVRANEALRLSEARYRALFEDLPVPAFEVDWSDLVAFVRARRVRSTQEFFALSLKEPQLLAEAMSRTRLCAVNRSALALAEVADHDAFENWRLNGAGNADPEALIRAAGPLIFEGAGLKSDVFRIRTSAGNLRDVLWQWAHVRESDTGWRFLVIVLDLTEQKRTERELIQKQERLDHAESIANLGHWEIDVATGTITGSPAYWKIYDGVAGGPLKRRAFDGHAPIHSEDLPRLRSAMDALFSAEPGSAPHLPEEWQFRIIRSDGAVRWVRSLNHVTARPGMPPLVYGVDQDVTEAKLAEDALKRSEQLYRDLFHNLPVAVWETDWTSVLEELARQGITTPEAFLEAMQREPARISAMAGQRRLLEANQDALDLLSVRTIAELSKATFPPKVAPEQAANFARTIAYAMFGQTPKQSFDLHIIRADGSEVDVDAFMAASNAAPGHVINMAVDVSARKAAERELLSSQAQLERAQAIAHVGSWELSLDRDELIGSREYWCIVDGTDDGPRARKFSEVLLRVHPDDRDRLRHSIQEAYNNADDGTAEEPVVEFRIVRPDGSLRVVTAQGVFARTTSGEVRGYGIQQDITELKKAEESARRQREELMRADRMISLGILVSGVAHEINNPNQFIILNAPFLRHAWKDIAPILEDHARTHPAFRVNGMKWDEMKSEIPEILSEIDRGADRIRSIVSELKAFGRDQPTAELRPSSLNEIIESSLRLMSNHVRRATNNFTTRLQPKLPLIHANPHRLEQVVINLVMNSCQALERTDAAISVETAWDAAANSVVMRVIDEGCGIPRENMRNIRDPFFTTKRASGGTGLGLPVSDKIVQEHNGSLSFESEPGLGTTAILRLPAIASLE